MQLSQDETRELRRTVRQVVDRELIPLESEVRRNGGLHGSLRMPLERMMRQLDLWAVDVPSDLGGQGLGLTSLAILAEELARCTFPSIRAPMLAGGSAGILVACGPQQRERYLEPVVRGERHTALALTEPDSGSDAVGQMRTTATRDGSGWLLNGTKLYISNVEHADFLQVMAVTDSSDRANGITCFLVDREAKGLDVHYVDLMIDERPAELVFTDCHVDESQVLGEVGRGMKLASQWLSRNRIVHSAKCIGRAQRALELAVEFARTRTTFGRPIADRQAIQFMIADSLLDLYLARNALYATCMAHDAGRDVSTEIPLLKIAANEGSWRTVDRCLQICGALGLSREYPMEQIFRELRSMRITEGTTEIHRWRIARNLLRDDRWPCVEVGV